MRRISSQMRLFWYRLWRLLHQFSWVIQLARSRLRSWQSGEEPVCVGIPDPVHAQQVVASVRKAVDEAPTKWENVLVPAITVLKCDWILLSMDHLLHLKRPNHLHPQPVNLPLQPSFLPLYGAHQLGNLGTTLTVIYTLPNWILIRNSSNLATYGSTPVSLKRHKYHLNPIKKNVLEDFRSVLSILPSSPSTPNDASTPPPFLVLADGADNPVSAKNH